MTEDKKSPIGTRGKTTTNAPHKPTRETLGLLARSIGRAPEDLKERFQKHDELSKISR
ncbi:MAG: hypothetical protein AABY33_10435 [Pseudomonadota bacterium]